MTRKAPATGHPRPQSYTIGDMAQIKALAHPLRMRIIETLAGNDAMTTKQVAEAIGEKPTKLYHHVATLENVGLIELQRTQPNRGTIEKYYQAIAREFRADSELFIDESGKTDKSALSPMIGTVLSNTRSELLRLLAGSDNPDVMADEGVLSYVEMHLKPDQIDEVRKRINNVLQYIGGLKESGGAEGVRKFRMTIAYFPLDRFDDRR